MNKIREILEKYAVHKRKGVDRDGGISIEWIEKAIIPKENFDKLEKELMEIDNWISVEDELPKVDKDECSEVVLVYADDKYQATMDTMFTAFILFGKWVAQTNEDYCLNPTHWQPLPNPPKQ